MKLIQLYRDYNVSFQTEGHKHCRDGWVNTSCPFCTGNPGLHLGATLDGKVFTCWRCGWKPTSKAVAELIGVNEYEAKKIIQQYGGTPRKITKKGKNKAKSKKYKMPSGTTSMQQRHKMYLWKRGYDPNKIETQWGILGTGPFSKLDGVNYSHRILAPIYWDNEQVSFQTRDITNKHNAKYMACPEEREIIKHKHILYGKQEKWGETGICVEGITDVWRIGDKSFATLGIKFTGKQLRKIAQNFNRVIILFDDDPQAIVQAQKLSNQLKFRNVKAPIELIEGDPADLSDKEAQYLIQKFY